MAYYNIVNRDYCTFHENYAETLLTDKNPRAYHILRIMAKQNENKITDN